MSYIDSFLNSYREKTGEMPKYLWQLKLNDNDYSELKRVLLEKALTHELNTVCREATLFYSEWWRREYNGGRIPIGELCRSLTIDESMSDDFHAVAKRGARTMGLQIIRTAGDNWKFSMLYQGGLPMNYISNNINDNNGWQRFFRDLAWKGLDFSSLQDRETRIILPLSSSIRGFCECIQDAATNNNVELLPFHPNISWWNTIKRELDEGIRERNARNPFVFKLLFLFDDMGHRFEMSFNVSGPRVLSRRFWDQHNLRDKNFCTISLSINDNLEPFAEYDGNLFSRRIVNKRYRCNDGDSISAIINETGEVLWTKYVDLSDPILLSLEDQMTNVYKTCLPSQMANGNCRIVATADWHNERLETRAYEFNNSEYKVFYVTELAEPLLLETDNDERKEFNHDSVIENTELSDSYALNHRMEVAIKERIFNAPDSVAFTSDTGNHNNEPVLYADFANHNWGNEPSFGWIRARIIREGHSLGPVKFLNVGNLSVTCVDSFYNSCTLRIDWPCGTVGSDEAVLDDGNANQWRINLDGLSDQRYVPFTFTPINGNPFVLHIIPPLYDFRICDDNGNTIENESIIPIVDIERFRYYLKLENRITLRQNNNRDLRYVYSNNEARSCNRVTKQYNDLPATSCEIAYEGRLSSLFMNGSAQIYDLLDESTRLLTQRDVKISFEGQNARYKFKEFPYILRYENDSLTIDNVNALPEYSGTLLAVPLDTPSRIPIELIKDSDLNCYYLPDDITGSGIQKWIVFGDLQGYILPKLIDFSNEQLNRQDYLQTIKEELINSELLSEAWNRTIDWYNLLPQGQIPGSSMLSLVAVADDHKLLTKFALQLYIRDYHNSVQMDILKESMMDFQKQMSFLWAWAYLPDGEDEIISWIPDNAYDMLRSYYYNWVIANEQIIPELKAEYITSVNEHFNECLTSFANEFIVWFSGLKETSIPERSLSDPDINTFGDRVQSDEVRAFFNDIPGINAGSDNDRWILIRRRVSEMFCDNGFNFGDIEGTEEVKLEIRRNIILGLKYNLYDEV